MIDAPGYGFAQKDEKVLVNWARMLETYFKESPYLRFAICLIDAHVGMTDSDKQLCNYLQKLGRRSLLVMTKADKSNMKDLTKNLKDLSEFAKEVRTIEPLVFLTSSKLNSQNWNGPQRASLVHLS